MRVFMLLAALLAVVLVIPVQPAAGQGDGEFEWGEPLNAGDMPEEGPLLPSVNSMPAPPLEEWGELIPGTIFINVEDFDNGYDVQTVTFDSRHYAFNLTTGSGVLPVSPNGRYGIYTVNAITEGIATCAIRDLVGNFDVDRFETDLDCGSVVWSPDSTRILLTIPDEDGNSALAIRANGETELFQPQPFGGPIDLGGAQWNPDELPTYLLHSRLNGWVSNDVISYEMVFDDFTVSQELFVRIGALNAGYIAEELTLEQTGDKRLVIWQPGQPAGALYRDIQVTDIVEKETRPLAPEGYSAMFADVDPTGDQVVYWAAPKIADGWGNPLRLVIYSVEDDSHTVLLEFDGPESETFVTRPGKLFWYPDGIYFHISQQSEEEDVLETGVYRITTDGSVLEYISPALLTDGIGN